MDIQISVVIAAMINFVLFFLVFRHFFYKPINTAIETRQNEITQRLKNTEDNQKKAEELRIQNEAQIAKAKEEGKVIVEKYKEKAEKMSSDIINNSNNEAQVILNRAKVEIKRQKDKAEDEIKKNTVEIAVMMSAKALEGTIDEKEHKKLIEDFISKVGA